MPETEVQTQAPKKTRRGKRGRGKKRAAAGDAALAAPQNARGATEKFITEAMNNPADNKLDPKYNEDAKGIRDKLEESRGKITELDDETKASLDEQRAAEEALQERGFARQRDSLLTRLFGQGRTEGNLAGEMGGQLIGDQQLVMQQIGAADAGNRTNMRMGLTQLGQQNLGMQGDMANQARAGELQRMGIASSERSNALNAATGLQGSYIGADAQKASARIGANAQIQSSQIGADASIQRARIGASASRYGSDRSLDAARIGAAAGVKSSMIGAAASRHNAMLALEGTKYGVDGNFNTTKYGVDSRERQFGQDLGLRRDQMAQQGELARLGYANNLDVANVQGKYQMQGIKAQQPSGMDKMLGMAGGLLSIFSDEKLKEDIEPIERPLRKVRGLEGVHFTWKRDGKRAAGLIAQDVQKVLPSAVREIDGDLTVDYTQVIGLLVAAVNELAKKVDVR